MHPSCSAKLQPSKGQEVKAFDCSNESLLHHADYAACGVKCDINKEYMASNILVNLEQSISGLEALFKEFIEILHYNHP